MGLPGTDKINHKIIDSETKPKNLPTPTPPAHQPDAPVTPSAKTPADYGPATAVNGDKSDSGSGGDKGNGDGKEGSDKGNGDGNEGSDNRGINENGSGSDKDTDKGNTLPKENGVNIARRELDRLKNSPP
jgi:hypothetical protein